MGCMSIVTNKEVIAVNQDPSGAPGRLAWQSAKSLQDDLQQIFVRALAPGDAQDGGAPSPTFAAVLFNRAESPRNITLTWDMLESTLANDVTHRGFHRLCTVRDLWLHRSL